MMYSDDEPTLSHTPLDKVELQENQSRPVVYPIDVRLRVTPVQLGPLQLDTLRDLDTYAKALETRAQAISDIESEARTRGYREGFEEAMRQNTQAFWEKLVAFEERLAAVEQRLGQVVLKMSVQLAVRCLGRELATCDEAIQHWIRTHTAALMPSVSVNIWHSATDASRLLALQKALENEFSRVRFTWCMDPELASGEMVFESENLRLDVRMEAIEGRLLRAFHEKSAEKEDNAS